MLLLHGVAAYAPKLGPHPAARWCCDELLVASAIRHVTSKDVQNLRREISQPRKSARQPRFQNEWILAT